VNTDVTAPGATLALGLMFLKSNNAGVAAVRSFPSLPPSLLSSFLVFVFMRVCM